MYTIIEPYATAPVKPKGTEPFFLVKDSSGRTVYYAVTRNECEAWILAKQAQ